MAKEKLSEAEKYRLERKKRIEKEKKKKNSYLNRNHQQVKKVEKIVGIVVAACVVVTIICLLLNFFGVFNRMITAARIGDQKVTVAEMNCAFADVKNQVYNASQQYEQSAGQGFYSNDTKSTDPCVYDSSKTWGEYFEEQALEHAKQIYAFKDGENNTLTEEQSKQISETFDTLNESAQKNNYSLNAYIREVYGIGVNAKVLRTWLENVYKAQNAQENLQDSYQKTLKDSDIAKYYKENKENYVEASAMAYSVKVDTTAVADKLEKEDISDKEVDKIIASAVKDAKAKANKIYAQVKADPSSFRTAVNEYEKEQNKESATTYTNETLTLTGKVSEKMSSLGKKAQNWIANASEEGQVNMIYSADYETKSFQFDIVKIEETAKNFSTVAVRHILIQPSDTEDDSSWKEAKDKINTIYEKWKKKPTEDYFASLATEETGDTGSKENGGLYESVTPGQMVDTFDAWCFDSSRKTGDTGIVKTTYGYHLMYFVKNNGVYWKTQVPTDMATNHAEDSVSDTLDKLDAEKANFGWNKIKEVQDYKSQQKSTTTTIEDTTAAAEEQAAEETTAAATE
ncbi:MAG: peptidylprolyl isomerase [Clostridia bacterium]|nr:peptidylprolyl isomerase [Clostridia bacterium]